MKICGCGDAYGVCQNPRQKEKLKFFFIKIHQFDVELSRIHKKGRVHVLTKMKTTPSIKGKMKKQTFPRLRGCEVVRTLTHVPPWGASWICPSRSQGLAARRGSSQRRLVCSCGCLFQWLSLSAHVYPRLPVSIAGVGQQKKGGKPAGKAAPPKKTGARRASDDAEGVCVCVCVCVWREREKRKWKWKWKFHSLFRLPQDVFLSSAARGESGKKVVMQGKGGSKKPLPSRRHAGDDDDDDDDDDMPRGSFLGNDSV